MIRKMLTIATVLSTSILPFQVLAECNGSFGKLKTPIIQAHNSRWSGGFFITNISNQPVTVTVNVTNTNGGSYSGPTDLFYNFSTSNSPVALSGATLGPGALGQLHFDDSNTVINVGEIKWYSDECLDEALMVTYYNQFSESSRVDTNMQHLNGGKPF